MRSLVLLTLVALAALPLSAHDHGRGPRRFVVVESPRCDPYRSWEGRPWISHRWEDRRWDEDRWEHRARYYRPDCEDDRVILRPLAHPYVAPFEGRVELRFR